MNQIYYKPRVYSKFCLAAYIYFVGNLAFINHKHDWIPLKCFAKELVVATVLHLF